MKKILIITNEFFHENLPKCGGTGYFYRNFCDQLHQNSQSVNVLVFSRKKAEITHSEYPIKVFRNYFMKYKLMNFLRSICIKFSFLNTIAFKVLRREKKYILQQVQNYIKQNQLEIDLIETHDFEGISLYFNELNLKYAIRCHGSWTVLEKEFGYKVNLGKKYAEKEALDLCKNVIAISKYNQNILNKVFNKQQTQLIYNGVDTDFYSNENTEVVPNKSLYFFGSITKEKGADVALDVFAEVLKKESKAKLYFIGDKASYYDELCAKIKQDNLSESVFVLGKKNKFEIKKLLSQANLVLMPSKGENFSLALLEAMSLSVPIVCSNIPSFLEIVEDEKNALIAQNKMDYVKKIMLIFENSNLANNLGENARKTIENHFSTNTMLEESLKYYNVLK